MIKVPGSLKSTKAVGWYLEEYGIAQVSMNLTNYNITSLHHAFEEVRKEANSIGLRVTGSEIVGLVPLEPLIIAGNYYLKKQKSSLAIPEKNVVQFAIRSLGLSEISTFDPNKKIIDYILESNNHSLARLTVSDFIDEVSSNSPAPGGGSVSALSGSLAASLMSMVSNLTYNKKGYEKKNQLISDIKAENIYRRFPDFEGIIKKMVLKVLKYRDSDNRVSASSLIQEIKSKLVLELIPPNAERMCLAKILELLKDRYSIDLDGEEREQEKKRAQELERQEKLYLSKFNVPVGELEIARKEPISKEVLSSSSVL